MEEEEEYVIVPPCGEIDHNADSDSPGDCSEISKLVDGLHETLQPLNKSIHENPELAFEEFKTHDALTSFVESHEGWEVVRSAYGMDTAWVASFNNGVSGPVVSFNAEMDALPRLGHACGHNLIAIASLAAALATTEMMKRHKFPGKVLLFGTPGEEGWGGGKIHLLNARAYDNVDITLISHPGIYNNSPLVRTTAFSRLEVEYFGRAAHAANSPWRGINALDALVIAYNAVSVLRQQTMPSDVIGMSITDGGGPPNIIHEYAAGVCVLRAATAVRLKELEEKVAACLRAGAEATGARAEIKHIPGYADHVPNRVLAGLYTKYWNLLPDVPDPPIPPLNQFTYVKASTDQGNLSYAMPSMNVSFAIPPGVEKGPPHTPDFEKASGTDAAFLRALRVAKALAGTAVEVLQKPSLVDNIKEQWKRDMDDIRPSEEGR